MRRFNRRLRAASPGGVAAWSWLALVAAAAPLAARGADTGSRITVSSKFNPAPSQTRWQEQAGVVAWTRTLPVGQRASFTADHTISHARGLPVNERQ